MTTQQTATNEASTTKPQRDAAVDQALADARKAADEARTEHARLEQVAREAQLAADAALAAFERDPADKTSTEERVAKQRAINARKAADDFAEAMTPTLDAEKRQMATSRLMQLRLLADPHATALAAADRIARLFADFQSGLASEISILDREVTAYRRTQRETNSLESTVGDGRHHPDFNMTVAIGIVQAKLDAKLGDSYGLVTKHSLPRSNGAVHITYASRELGAPDNICRARVAFIPGGDQGMR
jgi:hypothetical protein